MPTGWPQRCKTTCIQLQQPPDLRVSMGQKVTGKAVAKTMRDGTTLCPAFQQGNCKVKGAAYPKGAHRCGVVTRGQRTCNSANHGASACTVKTKS